MKNRKLINKTNTVKEERKKLNYKQKVVIRLTLVLVACIFLFVNLNANGGFIPKDVLQRSSSFQETQIEDMLINNDGIKFKVEEKIEFRTCDVVNDLDEVNNDILCVLPTSSQIGYLVYKEKKDENFKYDDYYKLRVSILEIDSISNFLDVKSINELVFENIPEYYTLSTNYIVDNNSDELISNFPSIKELNKQLEQDKKSYLKNNFPAYNQELMQLNSMKSDYIQSIENLKKRYKKTEVKTDRESYLIQIDELNKLIVVIDRVLEQYKILEEYNIVNSINGNK